MKNIKIFILIMIIGSSAIHAQTVTSYEYWFDNDYTGSVSYNLPGSQTITIANSFDCSGINQGFHTLNLRAKDNENKWSNTLIKYFYKGPVIAQNHLISGYEYWLDQQNTSRTFVAVNPDTLVQITGLIDLDTLNEGFHVLHFRAINLAGQWGNTQFQYFYKKPVSNGNTNIIAYEYWLDNDYSQKTSVSVSPGSLVQVVELLDLSFAQDGFHTFNIRFKDESNQWSITRMQYFYKAALSASQNTIAGYEYWFDNDYANKIAENGYSTTTLNITGFVECGNLANGFHVFQIRYKDASERWSNTKITYFYKAPNGPIGANEIVAYRYWVDTAYTNQTTVNLPNPVNPYQLITNIELPVLSQGNHIFNIQFKDQVAWGSVISQEFLYNFTGTSSNCTSQAGIMPSSTIELCAFNFFNLNAIGSVSGNIVLDANDGANYILHTSPSANLGDVISQNSTGNFYFNPSSMVYEQTYYVSQVVGNNIGTPTSPTVDLTDTCLSVSIGTPVKWYSYPSSNAGANFQVIGMQAQLQAQVPAVGVGSWSCITSNSVIWIPDNQSANATVIIPYFDTNQFGDQLTTTYTFRWTVQNGPGSCSSFDQVDVSFVPEITANAGIDQTVCGTVATLNAIFSPTASTGTWSGTGLFSNIHHPNSTVTVPSIGTYTFIWTVSNGIASDQDTVLVTFYQQPTANAGADTTICGLSYQLQASYSIGSSLGYWELFQGPAGALATWSDTTDPNAIVQVSAAGQYIFRWTENNLYNPSCSSFSNVSIEFQELQVVPYINNIQCNGDSNGTIHLLVIGGATPYSYVWDNGASGSLLQNLSAGVYQVTVSDALGCVVNDSFSVTQPSELIISATVVENSNAQVPNGAINITTSGGVSPYFYSWNTGASNESIQSLSVGNYFVTVSDSNNCLYTDSFQVASGLNTNFTCGDQISDYDGNLYNTVQIGNQCWMKENLNTTHDASGNSITRYCYNNETDSCDVYGGLYDWNTLMNGASSSNSVPSGVQGICPSGWHVPSDAEWDTIVNYLGGNVVAGGKMKEAGFTHWLSPNTDATNSSGFTVLPGGEIYGSGNFLNLGYDCILWSSTQYSSTYAWYRYMGFNSGSVYQSYYNKSIGSAVRCLKDSFLLVYLPILQTDSITGITTNAAIGGGEILDSGGDSITARGLCWNTTGSPTLADSFVVAGSGTGAFTAQLTNLLPGTIYYVRAFATNLVGTGYGNELSFTTDSLGAFTCGDQISDYDGNLYNTVQIGNQCWMKENLSVTHYSDGTAIPYISDSVSWINIGIGDRGYGYYNDGTSTINTYGAVYSWAAVMKDTLNNSPLSEVQGVCPIGWHVPSDNEWKVLEGTADSQYDYPDPEWDSIGNRGFDASYNLMFTSLWPFNYYLTDYYGFSVKPSSVWMNNGTFYAPYVFADFWTSTTSDQTNAINREFFIYGGGKVGRWSTPKDWGLSVRCIRDSITLIGSLPVVNTDTIVFVTQKLAIAGGEVISDGGNYVVERGFCWNTTGSPTLNDEHISNGVGVGIFECSLNGLLTDTVYFVRAYASNSTGVSYGAELQYVNTEVIFSCGDKASDYDGNIYNTVLIGSQCWLKENLRSIHYEDGTSLPNVTDDNDWANLNDNNTDKAYCFKNNFIGSEYGALYTWAAIMNGFSSSNLNPSNVQGICPSRWHIPSSAEWTELISFLGGDSIAGGKLKDEDTTYWKSPNLGATNESGFSALPGSERRHSNGEFIIDGFYGYWWSSTGVGSGSNVRSLSYNSTIVQSMGGLKSSGYSVRCIYDSVQQNFNLPTVFTDSMVSILQSSAIVGGQIIDNGGDTITARGVCWNITGNPTLTDSITIDGTGLGSFQSTITGLSAATTYYVRAYATNSVGTGYGNELSFTTDSLGAFTCGDQISDYDGNLYNTVLIGNQCWMKEDLRSSHYTNGDSIQYITNDSIWGTLGDNSNDKAYCFHNNDTSNQGAEYTWAAAMNGASSSDGVPSGVQGLCPAGWHLPSDNEWKVMELFLGMSPSEVNLIFDRGTIEGGQLKEQGLTHWNYPNAGATNSTGFTALSGGYRTAFGGGFSGVGYENVWWSSTGSFSSATIRRLTSFSAKINRNNAYRSEGIHIRCLKDIVDTLSLIELITPNLCTGDSSGSIDIIVIGGTTPNTFNWSNGSTSEDIETLMAGNYSITVTDASNDTVIGNYSLSDPPALDLNYSSSNYNGYAISCYGASDGSIMLSIMGGVSPYTYLWNTGATSADIYNLSANSYFITATDNNGCEISGGLTLNEPSQLEITTISNDFNGFGIQCNGENNGSISSTVSGGVTPYLFNWSNGSTISNINLLSAGTYSVSVTDMNGCMVSDSELITEPDELILNTQVTNVSTVGGSNGSVEMIASGGVTPYTYYFEGYPSNSVITGLSAGSYFVGVIDANNCFYNGEGLVLESVVNSVPDWTYSNTGSSHTILISDSIPLTIDGVTISNGDYIGVFYDSLGVLACGGYIEWAGVNTALTAWGNDNLTVEQDGFLVGEAFKWKIWQQSSGEVFNASAQYIPSPTMPNQGEFAVNGLSGLTSLSAFTIDYQYINLPMDWSYFSTYIDPFEANIDSVLNPIVNSVVIAKDRFGNSYWPLYGVNMIGNIIIGDAYQVKMLNVDTLSVEGLAVEPEYTPIVIPQGWSFIAYLRQSSAPIETMLSSLMSDLIIVKNSIGNSYWPTYGVNTIVDMNPGEGYQFKMNAAHTLFYPSNSINYSKSMIEIPTCKYYTDITNTGNNMTLGIYQDMNLVEPGDEIGIYSKSGLLVGASVVGGDFTSVTIWGDDELSSTVDGMIPGEMYEIRVWDCHNLSERTLQPNKWIAGDNGYFPNKIAIVTCILDDNSSSHAFELYQNVPNPFAGKTEIKFYVPENSYIELDIYNVIGKHILHVSGDEYEIGTHTISLDLDHLKAGTYYYRLKSEQYEKTRKMIKLND